MRKDIGFNIGIGGHLTTHQQKRMKKIKENNGIYLIVHGVAELEYLLEPLL